ncbi:transcription repressor NadR [Bacillus salitolerans]|uniref:Transcription repressor NadR n=1 Tax=Bacillus salitolerans TaxID=1437434 RepID=A0ABW4LPS3_9BACI
MPEGKKKLAGEERRQYLLDVLKNSQAPMKGSELAVKANVSRQVIVGDMSLLKAKQEPILATSEGYIYIHDKTNHHLFEQVVVCQHTPDQTKEELFIIVDHGVRVKDVKIEHPVYGDLTASVMVSNRSEVEQFLTKLKETNAPLLSELTDGIHLHTLEADSQEKLERACRSLRDAGILLQA